MHHTQGSPLVGVITTLVILVLLYLVTLSARRKGYSGPGTHTIVRCREGHLFTTIWMPGASFKALRLGMYRFQFCPVGQHWTLVAPVKEDELTEAEKQFAAEHHDSMIP